MMRNKKFWVVFAVVVIIFVLVRLYICLAKWMFDDGIFLLSQYEFQYMTGWVGPIGDFIGGTLGPIISLLSVVMLICTLNSQNTQFERDKFNQVFFEMMHVHNENVNSFILVDKGETIASGRRTFTVLLKEYEKMYEYVNRYVDNIVEDKRTFPAEVRGYLEDSKKRCLTQMKLSYGYFYFGTDRYILLKQKENEKENEKEIEKKYKIELIVDEHVRKWMSYNGISCPGHSAMLGHYFRHLYQTYILIANNKTISEDEKYDFAKLQRAQMDDDELRLLYYNSMSEVGLPWRRIKKDPIKKPSHMCIISRFKLLKRLPHAEKFYGLEPQIAYEDEVKLIRGKGDKSYLS